MKFVVFFASDSIKPSEDAINSKKFTSKNLYWESIALNKILAAEAKN